MDNLQNNGYQGKVEYSEIDEVFFGTIEGISDLVTFEGVTLDELHIAFKEVIDD